MEVTKGEAYKLCAIGFEVNRISGPKSLPLIDIKLDRE